MDGVGWWGGRTFTFRFLILLNDLPLLHCADDPRVLAGVLAGAGAFTGKASVVSNETGRYVVFVSGDDPRA